MLSLNSSYLRSAVLGLAATALGVTADVSAEHRRDRSDIERAKAEVRKQEEDLGEAYQDYAKERRQGTRKGAREAWKDIVEERRALADARRNLDREIREYLGSEGRFGNGDHLHDAGYHRGWEQRPHPRYDQLIGNRYHPRSHRPLPNGVWPTRPVSNRLEYPRHKIKCS